MRSFLRKALSQYEGEKRLDKANESLAVGRLSQVVNPVTHRGPVYGGDSSLKEHVGEWWCTVCKTWKRSFKLVRVRTGGYHGERVKNMKGRYIKACAGCAAAIEGAS